MTDHDYIMSVLRPFIPDRPLDEPEPSNEAIEHELERDEKYQAALDETLRGAGPFWDSSSAGADCEYEFDVFRAVRGALALPFADDAHRWQFVKRAIDKLADDYAQMVREGIL